VQRCVVRRSVWHLISRLVAVFIWFLLKDQLQSITDLINDLCVVVADPEACVFWWLKIYQIIYRHFCRCMLLTWMVWVCSQIHHLRS